MKKLTRSTVIALMLFAASALPAQAQLRTSDFTFYGAGQAVAPTVADAFRSSYHTGLGIGAGLGIRVTEEIDFRVFGGYSRLALNADRDGAQGALYVRSLDFGLQREIRGGEELRVYAVGTFGLDRYDYEPLAGTPGQPYQAQDETAFSVAGGLGLLFPLSYTAAFFVEPTYRLTLTAGDATHYVPVRLGFVFGEF